MNRKVTDRGQVTIPKSLRTSLGIRPGDRVEFEERDGTIVLRKVVTRDPIEALVGLIREPVDVDAYIADTRGPAHTPDLDPD